VFFTISTEQVKAPGGYWPHHKTTEGRMPLDWQRIAAAHAHMFQAELSLHIARTRASQHPERGPQQDLALLVVTRLEEALDCVKRHYTVSLLNRITKRN
jgi:hypothetical protein